MRRKVQPKTEPVVAPEILEQARRAVGLERPVRLTKCTVCAAEVSGSGTDGLCWVCRRLKISAWRDVEAAVPAQE